MGGGSRYGLTSSFKGCEGVMRDFNAVIAAVLAMNGAQAWANMMPPPPPAVKVDMYSIDAKGMGPKLGHITITETLVGLMFTPDLKGLPPGERGFHVHEVGNCAPGLKDGAMTAGWSAGAHYDPAKTGKHVGPHKEGGHKGDLEVLKVGADGTAKTVAMSK
ncbi:MAG TPA: hypothetical protein DCL54_10285, partial [Alphaproteobacteria bacterium]|nr:hypothetical protein [Alphaproteobacteria bacterium]